MITCEISSGSARHAISILHAWERRDLPRLHTALQVALSADPTQSVSSGEAERGELLRGIAWEMRAAPALNQPQTTSDAERLGVCISLLRHLVSTDS